MAPTLSVEEARENVYFTLRIVSKNHAVHRFGGSCRLRARECAAGVGCGPAATRLGHKLTLQGERHPRRTGARDPCLPLVLLLWSAYIPGVRTSLKSL
jgi:hypothetical protein